MGCLYQPTYKGTDGTTKKAAVWWLKYRANGRIVRVSSETTDKAEARRLLKRREGAIEDGRPVAMKADRVTVGELLEELRTEYQANGRRSLRHLGGSIAHLAPQPGAGRAAQLTTADINSYIVARQAEGAANASINRELAALKRAYSLAVRSSPPRVHVRPYIPMLREDNTRRGFLEEHQYRALRAAQPAHYRGVVTFAYETGWRLASEILPLQWHQVDFQAGVVRLEPGTTKNGKGRTFYLTPELRACLEAQRAATDDIQRRGLIVPWVFHRNGRAIKGLRKPWRAACLSAGCPGRIPHDFRRTAVRNLERAGVPRSTAMEMVGHRTESVYRRYAIVDEQMLREGSEKLARAGQSRGQSGVKSSAPLVASARF